MVLPTRLFSFAIIWIGTLAACQAASVPTERVIAPRSLELVPGISAPGNAPELQKQPPVQDDKGKIPPKPAEPDESSQPETDPNLAPDLVEDPDLDDDPNLGEDPDQDEDNEIVKIPDVQYGEDKLPAAVRQMRKDILEAATNVDFRRLKLVYDANDEPPTLSFDETGDPIEILKKNSGDPEGLEILAIMIEILQAGWVHKNPGEPDEMYIWPYFAELSLDQLTKKQKVELYEIVTASDVEEMETFGSYIFYRLGIGPDGTWYFFVAGD